MNIYLFNKARAKALEKSDKFYDLFTCRNIDHTNPLLTGLTNDLLIFLWCLECNDKTFIGQNTYDELIRYEGVSFEDSSS